MKSEHESATASSSATETSNDEIVLKIVSASYGPLEGQRMVTGEWSHTPSAKIPNTRDVTPILRALLQLQEEKNSTSQILLQQRNHAKTSSTIIVGSGSSTASAEEDDDPHLVHLKAIAGGTGGMKRTSIVVQALHDGWNSMNVVFGDACPGISKKLQIHYLILDTIKEVHHVTFAEYEPVILRRRVTFYQDETQLQQAAARVMAKKQQQHQKKNLDSNKKGILCLEPGNNNLVNNDEEEDEDEQTLIVAHRMGRSQSILEFSQLSEHATSTRIHAAEVRAKQARQNNNLQTPGFDSQPEEAKTKLFQRNVQPYVVATTRSSSPTQFLQKIAVTNSPTRRTRLRSATFEIVLPVVLSFLQVRERVQCRLVCRLWRNIVRDWGVAAIIDCTDPSFKHAFTRPFLRGILMHSFASLHSLRLSDFQELRPEDLNPSLLHLKKLRVLDISRCTQIKDETLQLLARYNSDTLEVLYIKGLGKVTDDGIIPICETCRKLKVLEVSYISMTDASGVAIGQHLTNLRALYMRDNFRLTNVTIDAITASCKKLNQLTLWGCVNVKHLNFEDSLSTSGVTETENLELRSTQQTPSNLPFATRNLVSLNLWGCFKLSDDVALALGNMKKLRSLIVSECHRLTDKFAVGIAQHLPQLLHLHLRYCKRLTDEGVNAIASGLTNLYSLDLSFCSRLTAQSLCGLLEQRRETLSELRLQECRQLQIVRDPNAGGVDRGAGRHHGLTANRVARDAHLILKSLRLPGSLRGMLGSNSKTAAAESNLAILDLRCCGGQPNIGSAYPISDPFVQAMRKLQFEQKTPGYFARPARWNARLQAQLLQELATNKGWAN